MVTDPGPGQVDDRTHTLELVSHHRFGYLSDLTSVLYMRDELQAQHRFLIPAEALLGEMFDTFSVFDSADQLPGNPVLSLSVMELGAARPDKMHFGMKRIGR